MPLTYYSTPSGREDPMGKNPLKRTYVPLDRAYLKQDNIRDLLAEFGPGGRLVFLAIILQAHYRTGVCDDHISELAVRTGTTQREVRGVIDRCVDLGLLEVVSKAGDKISLRCLKHQEWSLYDKAGVSREDHVTINARGDVYVQCRIW
jgi:hypothetical protein